MKRLFNFFVFGIIGLLLINCQSKNAMNNSDELQIEVDSVTDMCSDYYKMYYNESTDTVFVSFYEYEQGLQTYYVNMYGINTLRNEYIPAIMNVTDGLTLSDLQNDSIREKYETAKDIIIDYKIIEDCYERYNPVLYDWSDSINNGFYTLGMIDKEIGELITRIRIWNDKFL